MVESPCSKRLLKPHVTWSLYVLRWSLTKIICPHDIHCSSFVHMKCSSAYNKSGSVHYESVVYKMYVVVIRFVLHALSSCCWLHLKKWKGTCVALANLPWSINTIQIEDQNFLDLVIGYRKKAVHVSWFFNSPNWIHCLVFSVQYKVVDRIVRRSPISSIHVSLWCLFFDPHLTTHPSNIGVWSKKSNQITHTHTLSTPIHRGSENVAISTGIYLYIQLFDSKSGI